MKINLTLLALMALASQGVADELPRGLGHPDGHAASFYDSYCCSAKDCEPVEWSAATQEQDGTWRVHYRTSRGFVAFGVVGGDRVKLSRDGFMHACARPPSGDASRIDGYAGRLGQVICLYIVPMT